MNRQSHSLLWDIANMMKKSNHCYPVPPKKIFILHMLVPGATVNLAAPHILVHPNQHLPEVGWKLRKNYTEHGGNQQTYSEASTTLPETNSEFTPENRLGPHRKFHLPTIHFQGRTLSFRERKTSGMIACLLREIARRSHILCSIRSTRSHRFLVHYIH